MLHLSPLLTAYLLLLAALLGLVMGSFCNAWAWRLVHGESIARGRSHCARCGHPLSAADLVPLLSYLLLRGRCRYCKAPVSRRYPIVEVVSAAFFVSVLLVWDVTLPLLRLLPLGCLLLTAALVDLDTRELPDPLLLAAGILFFLRYFEEGLWGLGNGLLGGAILGGGLLLLVLLADKVLGRETMGGGDIKLLAVLGLHFGPALGLLLLILACLLGLAQGLALQKRGYPGAFPFGPALAAAAWGTAVFGAPLLAWYLGLFGL